MRCPVLARINVDSFGLLQHVRYGMYERRLASTVCRMAADELLSSPGAGAVARS